MEIPGNELLKQARELLEKGEQLELAASYFNRLYNETLKGHGEPDIFLFYLGSVHMKLNNDALSILLFNEAIKLNPGFIEAINNLGYMYKKVGFFDEAKKCFERVLALVPTQEKNIPLRDKADYLTNLGSLLIANGTPLQAIEYFDKASLVTENSAYNLWNRSLAYLELGDYERGFRDYDCGDRNEKSTKRTYGRKELPDWDGTPGKTIVVFGEQGIGDEIMFASMLPDAWNDCRLIIDAHPRLANFFRLNFPRVPVYGTRKETCDKIAWQRHHNIDAKIAMGSLGKFYRKKESDFPKVPYLVADPELTKKYAERLDNIGSRPKIGISWMGGTVGTGRKDRCIPLDAWLDILKLDADFISLQYDKGIAEEIKQFENKHSVILNHWEDVLFDYDETAGLVSNLDLIISVPQSVVHLAGAMGKAVWQLTPFKAMWQMGRHGEDMPWYQTTRNFWQNETCDWQPVMDRLKGELCNLLQKNIES